MTAGRPRLIKSVEEMESRIAEYFADCDQRDVPYTIAGMAWFLGFCDRTALAEYETRPEFSSTVKRARLKVEMQRSERLASGDGNKTGMIFDLMNNFGWKDQRNLKHSGDEEHPLVGVIRWQSEPSK
jgi:hypothetical protein